jgi:hypothetical protein
MQPSRATRRRLGSKGASIMKSHVLSFALLSLVIFASAPTQAQNGSLTRSFVSSAGADSNPCTITQPCQSFAVAYTKIGPNGIIAALDPGKYGPLTGASAITTGVTINGNGWAAITAPANGNGITINAGTANVTLIGLEIDGVGIAYNGVVLNSAGSLTVSSCILQNFSFDGSDINTGNGILMQPTSGPFTFTITNTTASNNKFAGILYAPPSGSPVTNGVIDHVVTTADFGGISLYPFSTTNGSLTVALSNSVVSGNTSQGIYIDSSPSTATNISMDTMNVSGNDYGIIVNNSANASLARSVVTGSAVGIQNSTTPQNNFYSYQNNQINFNASNFNTGGYTSFSTATLQ